MNWIVNSRGKRINVPRNAKQRGTNYCMQKNTRQNSHFCLGYPSKQKGAENRPPETHDSHHTFHMPHHSPLVRNTDYICATKPFKIDKAVCARRGKVPERPEAAPWVAARDICLRGGLKQNLARSLWLVLAKRQRSRDALTGVLRQGWEVRVLQ